MPPTSTTPDSIDSPSSDPPEVTAENAAEILAADDETETVPATGRVSRRRLLIGGTAAAAALIAGGAWLTLRRTNQGVVGAAQELPLVIGETSAPPLCTPLTTRAISTTPAST